VRVNSSVGGVSNRNALSPSLRIIPLHSTRPNPANSAYETCIYAFGVRGTISKSLLMVIFFEIVWLIAAEFKRNTKVKLKERLKNFVIGTVLIFLNE
jgi:hypothetical protein